MALFPSLEPRFLTDQDTSLLSMMDSAYNKNMTINMSFWGSADQSTRFEAGDQQLWNTVFGNIPSRTQRQYYFNHIRRIVNMITGYQKQHRKSCIYTPVESSDQKTSDQASKLWMHIQNNSNALHVISEAFHTGAVVTGMSLISLWIDYTDDPVNGDIKLKNLPYNTFCIDPFFRQLDMSDCNNVWIRRYVTAQQAAALIPDKADEIKNMRSRGSKDGKFQFLPEAYNYGSQDLLIYDEFWYLTNREATFISDVENGETKEWQGDDEQLAIYREFWGNKVQVYKQMIPTVKLGIVLQGHVMYHGKNPLNIDRYPFVPCVGYWSPQLPYLNDRVQGVVQGLVDSQYLFNRKMGIQMDILESQLNSGWVFNEDAPVNPADVFLTGQGRGIPIKSGVDIRQSMMRIEPPGINPTMMELTNQIASEMTNISGVNEELLGSADDDKSGILSMLRQGAGLITLQGLFDNLDYSQKLVGELCMEIWQNNWTPGKVRRILGEEPSEQFYNKAFHKYNCVVEEGINTSTQKQMQAHQLLKLKEMGAPIEWSLVIEALPLQRKAELMESLKKQEEQGQKSQMEQMQAQMALLQAQIKEMDARAEAQQGLGIERASRVAENYALGVERRAAAEKDLAAKDLDHAKAIKEMEGMDIRQIQDAISVLSQVRDLLAPQQELSNNSFNVQNEVQGAMQRMGAPRQSPVPSGGPMAAPAPMRGMETT